MDKFYKNKISVMACKVSSRVFRWDIFEFAELMFFFNLRAILFPLLRCERFNIPVYFAEFFWNASAMSLTVKVSHGISSHPFIEMILAKPLGVFPLTQWVLLRFLFP